MALAVGGTKTDYGSFPQAGLLGKGDDDAPPRGAPPRRATWTTAATLIIADVIGLGIMGMADAFAELGWVLGVLVCVLMLPLNIYCGLLVHGAQTGAFSTAISMAEIARQAVGPWGYWATATLVYTFIFLVLGDYLLSMGLCLEQLFPDASFSRPVWTLLGATVLLPFCQVRTLNDTRLLLWVNIGALIVSVCVSLGYLISGEPLVLAGRAEPPAAVAPSISWTTGTAGLSKIVFAYVGALMYPEIIVEMVEPADFPKALYAGAPFQLGSFLLVGCVGYGYLGSRYTHTRAFTRAAPGRAFHPCG